MKRIAVAFGAACVALACEAFVDEAWSPPPCCATPCPENAQNGAVLVAPNGILDGGACGTPDSPCGSVGAALAQKGVSVVAIAMGTYVETIDVRDFDGGTVLLCGGYASGTWSRGDASSSIIGTDSVALDNHSSGPSCLVLDGLDIASKAQADPGETLVGVYASRVSGSASDVVCTRETSVSVARGGDGLDGDAGADGVVIACSGDAGGTGANGADGDAGAPATAGYFDLTGAFVSGDGQTGARGGDGIAGAYAPTTCSECGYCVDCSSCSNGWKTQPDPSMCSAGSAGCGGGGGGAGAGGRGGGASVAMVVVGMHLDTAASRLTAQSGGRGGLGAVGGTGVSGTGAALGHCTACDTSAGLPMDSTTDAGVQQGGGAGGHGGAGANGAGGWSCAIVVDDAGAASLLDGGVLLFAEGGAGAPAGQAAAICHTR